MHKISRAMHAHELQFMRSLPIPSLSLERMRGVSAYHPPLSAIAQLRCRVDTYLLRLRQVKQLRISGLSYLPCRLSSC